MTVALILLVAMFGVGILLYVEHRFYLARRPEPEAKEEESQANNDDACCGLHITCEKDSLLAAVSDSIEYYDDEELDRFAHKAENAYTDDEVEEFREILLTMRADDIAGWARSLQLRQISLPPAVRDELIMIVSEARSAKANDAVF
ncbi:MAG: phospholipase [Muribaculaceae bacterium]|nr:phospholipase [Muribaculaceae bacterium]